MTNMIRRPKPFSSVDLRMNEIFMQNREAIGQIARQYQNEGFDVFVIHFTEGKAQFESIALSKAVALSMAEGASAALVATLGKALARAKEDGMPCVFQYEKEGEIYHSCISIQLNVEQTSFSNN